MILFQRSNVDGSDMEVIEIENDNNRFGIRLGHRKDWMEIHYLSAKQVRDIATKMLIFVDRSH